MSKLFEGDLNRWVTINELKNIFPGLNEENINIFLFGLSGFAAKSSNRGYVVHLEDLKKYLKDIKMLADLILEGPPEETPPSPAQKTAAKGGRYFPDTWITGKAAALRLSISHEEFIKMAQKGEIAAKKWGRGWVVDPKAVEDYLAKQNPDSSASGSGLPICGGQDIIQANSKSDVLLLTDESDKKFLPAAITADTSRPPPASDAPEGNSKNNPQPENSGSNNVLPVPPEKVPAVPSPASRDDPPKPKNPFPPLTPSTSCLDDNPTRDTERVVCIRKGKNGCKEGDVALAVGVAVTTVRKWIKDGAVRTNKALGQDGSEEYIDAESLRDFFAKQRQTRVTFEERRGNIKIPAR